jgi:hypothetical protein
MSTEAQKQAIAILCGVNLLATYDKNARLVALDKCLLCNAPKTLAPGHEKELQQLGWYWSATHEAWEFYTGHG